MSSNENKCKTHNVKLGPEGECWKHEREMWDHLQDDFGDRLKCPFCQNKVESRGADTDYWEYDCTKCHKGFRIVCCSDCGVPECGCYDGFDDYEPCDGCKNTPSGSPRVLCQGGGCRG